MKKTLVDLDVPLAIALEILELRIPGNASLARYSCEHVVDPRHHTLPGRSHFAEGMVEVDTVQKSRAPVRRR